MQNPLIVALSRIKNVFNQPQTVGQTARTVGIDKSPLHPGNRLSPGQLKSILAAAETGQISDQHALFDDIEESDAAIAANLDMRKRAILTLDWSIHQPKDTTPAAKKQHDLIVDWFEHFAQLEDLFIDLMDAVGHGFAAIEISWKRDGHVWLPSRFSHVSQTHFIIKDDAIRLQTLETQDGIALWPLGWIIHRHQSRSAMLARGGLFRTLTWLYLFKYYSVRDFAEFLELYGMPIRIGKYPYGASKEEKRTLLRAVSEIGHNAAGIMPEGMALELKDAATSTKGDPFMQMINWCEKSVARLILGQTLTSGTDTATNTNALGNVHQAVRHDLLVSDAKQLAQTLTKQLILPILQINIKNVDAKRIPRFRFDTAEYEDIATYADSLPKLVEIGMRIPEAYARKKLGIPEPQDDEPLLALPQATQAQTALRQTALSAAPPSTEAQALIDTQVDLSAAHADFMAQLDSMIAPIAAALAESNSYEQAADALTALYPHLDSAAHQRYLQNALVFAALLGEHHAQS